MADALSCLDIDDLAITKEQALASLSESEHDNTKFPIYTALIFKEKTKVPRLREKGLSQTYYSIQHFKGFDLECYKDKFIFLIL
jgi:hypothetical protein